MRPLKREGRRSQYCGPSDSPKHTEFCHDRSSILITRLMLLAAFALCQSFWLAMSGHAGSLQMDLGVTPLVYWISCGQAVALAKGRRACRADLFVSNRACDGNHGQPESCDDHCQPELCRGVGE